MVLPEIEVREIVSVDALLAEEPTFMAFTERDIETKIRALISNGLDGSDSLLERKTEAFRVLHRIATQTTSVRESYYNAKHLYVTDARRRDNSDLRQIVEDYGRIDKAPNLRIHQQLLDQYSYPLTDTAADNKKTVTTLRERQEVILGFDPMDIITLLPTETVVADEEIYLDMPQTDRQTMAERVACRAVYEEVTKLTFEQTVNLWSDLPTLQEVERVLIRFTLSAADTEILRRRLTRLAKRFNVEAARSTLNVMKSLKPRAWRPHSYQRPLLEALNDPARRAAPLLMSAEAQSMILPDTDFERAALPRTEAEMVADLLSGRTAGRAIVEALRKAITVQCKMDDLAFMRRATVDDTAGDQSLATAQRKWGKVGERLKDLIGRFLEVYKDEDEFRAGTDASNYDGDPIGADDLFDNKEAGEVFRPLKAAFSPQPNAPFADDDQPPLDAETVLPAPDRTPGKLELLREVTSMISALRTASKLPLSPDIFQRATADVVRVRRADVLRETFPDMTDDILARILAGENVLGNSTIEKANGDFHRDVQAYTIKTVALWTLQIQRASLEGTLDFQGSDANAMLLWSPVGPPFQRTSTGVLPYLSSLAATLIQNDEYGRWTTYLRSFSGTGAFEQAVLAAMETFPEELAATEAAFKEKHHALRRDAGELAEASLIQALEAKDKRAYHLKYLQVLVYLPRLMATRNKAAAGMASGCCLQKLGPEFRANQDFKDHKILQRMEQLKGLFAKRRLGREPRPVWARAFGPEGLRPVAVCSHVVVDKKKGEEEAATDQIDHKEWFKAFQTLIPKEHYVAIGSDAKAATQLAKSMAITNSRVAAFLLSDATPLDEFMAIQRAMPTLLNGLLTLTTDARPDEGQWIRAAVLQSVALCRAGNVGAIITPVAEPFIRRVLQYTIMSSIPSVSGNVTSVFAKKAGTALMQAMETKILARHVPTEAEVQATIDRLREEQKIEIIRIQDVMTDDDHRAAFNQLKAIVASKEYMEGREIGEVVVSDAAEFDYSAEANQDGGEGAEDAPDMDPYEGENPDD